jgi:glycosyltransferase involved in cell wall biosynthesis
VTSPSVTIVVAAHNPTHLDEMLRSIASQGLPELDVILVDDGSEPPLRVAEDLALPVRVVRRDVAGERAEARNAGLREARGDWVMVVDHDDLLAQGAISRMLEVAEASGSGAVFARMSRVGAHESAPYVQRWRGHPRARPIPWWQVFCSSDHLGMILARTDIACQVGYAAEFVPADDYFYAIGVAAATDAVRVARIVGAWRMHPQQTTQVAADSIPPAVRDVRAHVLSAYAPSGTVRRRVCAYVALHSDAHAAWRAGDLRAFRRAVGRAAMGWPPVVLTRPGAMAVGAAVVSLLPRRHVDRDLSR